MVWNEETIRSLTALWIEGYSTAEIGRRLGVSKNAIVGKAHRLVLKPRPSPIRRESATLPSDRLPGHTLKTGPTLPPLASVSVVSNVTLPSNVKPLRPSVSPGHDAVAINANLPNAGIRAADKTPAASSHHAPPNQVRRSAPSCCWPIGDPGTKAFRFCDDFSLPGKPYCDQHAKLAYVKIRDRKEDAA